MAQPYKILAIVGKSAAGKDTFYNILKKNFPTFNRIKEFTTRPKRDQTDNNYTFLSYKDYLEKFVHGEIFGNSQYNTWNYGFDKNSLKENAINIAIMNIQQLDGIINNPEYDIYILYLEASNKTRLTRSLYREAEPDCKEICRRFLADDAEFKDFEITLSNLNNVSIFNTDGTPADQNRILKLFVSFQEWAKDIKIL